MTKRTCTITDCDRPTRARGLCGRHYQRQRNTGSVADTIRTLPERDRFWAKVDRSGDCWEWTAGKNVGGYGRFTLTGSDTNVAAHRYAYEDELGPIPEGMDLDHLCRNRACVRPSHLEPVTNKVNVLRGVAPTADNARKTHCPEGHEYSPENTRIYRGYRYCRTCQRAHSRKRMAAKRAREREHRIAGPLGIGGTAVRALA